MINLTYVFVVVFLGCRLNTLSLQAGHLTEGVVVVIAAVEEVVVVVVMTEIGAMVVDIERMIETGMFNDNLQLVGTGL